MIFTVNGYHYAMKIYNNITYYTEQELSERLDKTIEASKEVLRTELRESQKHHINISHV